jgi:excisionase family DNA binding protein
MTGEHAPMDPPTDTYGGTYCPADGDRTRLLTVQEAAGALGVSPTTIRRWVKEGAVASERVSRPQGYVVMVQIPERQIPTGRYAPRPPGVATQLPTSAPTDAARAEAMAEYSAKLLEPLVAKLAEQAEDIGRLRAQLERAHDTIRALEAPREVPADAPESHTAGRETASPGGAVQEPAPAPPPWWRRVWAALAG